MVRRTRDVSERVPITTSGRMNYEMNKDSRNLLMKVPLAFVNLWNASLGIVGLLSFLAIINIPSLAWLILYAAASLILLTVSSIQHGILRKEASYENNSTISTLANDSIYVLVLAQLLFTTLLLTFSEILYVWTKDEDASTLEINPVNGQWSYLHTLTITLYISAAIWGLCSFFILLLSFRKPRS